MLTGRRWIVRLSRFPIGEPGQAIGSIIADDSRAAWKLSIEVFGAKAVVEPETSIERRVQEDPYPYRNPVIDQGDELAHVRKQLRRMSVVEVQMARSLGVLKASSTPKHWRGTIRRLHAETFKPAPEISDEIATLLRTIVKTLASQLPPEIVEAA